MDLYLIEDSQPKPLKVSSLTLLGRIKDDEFILLQKLSIIESRYDYYKDLRWSREQVQDIYQLAFTVSTPFKFKAMLLVAIREQMGIIGYAD